MTYWNKEGKYLAEYNKLVSLIPIKGKCKDSNLELLRLTTNAYYDIYNNGGCNHFKFVELYDEVIKYWEAGAFNFERKQELIDFLAFVKTEVESDEQCSGYLFQWGKKQTNFQKTVLQVFEEFANWVVITTYENLKK